MLDKHGHQVTFDYEARPVLDEVIASGCLPDRVSHQYYPTPPDVAAAVVAQAAIEPGHTILEPSAGQGALAALLPRESTVCIEVSHLHGLVLKGKGFTMIEADFLVWAKTTTQRFDRVVMNPPFSEGRALLHLRAAATLLKPGGRLVAVLPGGQRGKLLLPAEDFTAQEWSERIENQFDGTGVTVAILAATRKGAA